MLSTRLSPTRRTLTSGCVPNPRVSEVNYIGIKKSERSDMEEKLGLLKGLQVTPNTLDRAKLIAKGYFDEKGFKNAEIKHHRAS